MAALFQNYPKIAEGVALMCKRWERSGKKILAPEGKCISFQDPDLGIRGKVAFRIEIDPPTIAVYDGNKDSERGSPLMKPASKEKERRLIESGFKLLRTADWKKPLDENIPLAFYEKFIQYALKVCQNAYGQNR